MKIWHYRSLWLALPALCCAVLVPAISHGAQPTRTTILIDGVFSDWQTVFANPANLIVDGDGSTLSCNESPDRDCIVAKKSEDISLFAVTWDDQNLYLYVERLDTANNVVFLLYVDAGHDGFFDSNDYILEHEFRASQNSIVATKWNYAPLNPLGDPTEDALGLGDGYAVPGDGSGPVVDPGDPTNCANCTSNDGLAFEFAWPWASLGIAGDQAVIYHLASAGSVSASKVDNAGGPNDRRGSTQFAAVGLDPARLHSIGPDEALFLPHVVTNTGNQVDTYRFAVTSGLGMQVCLYSDPDLDGLPDALIGCDRQGNGSWVDNGDMVEPQFDSDADTVPDTGPLAPRASFAFVGEIVPAKKHNKKIELTRFTVTSAQDPLVSLSVRDETSVGHITITPKRELRATPSAVFYAPHIINSHLPTLDVFDVQWSSTNGWSYTIYSDPNADGDPADGVPIFDTDGDTDPDVNIPSGGSFPIVAVGVVPGSTPVGVREELTVSTRASGNVTATVTDEILVARLVELHPEHTRSLGLAKSGSASYPTFFRHYLTWNGDAPAQFDLIGLSSQGYAVDFYTDPNGDGNPADGVLIPEPARSPVLSAFGDTWEFLVRVSIPTGTAAGIVDTTDIFAVHSTDFQLFDKATDETVVTQIQVFEDPTHTLSISHSPVCTTVYARATGLSPSVPGRYRIEWADPTGQTQRTVSFTPNSQGIGFDTLQIQATSLLGPWSAAVQELIQGSWQDLDRVELEVENEGVMDALFTDLPVYSIADQSLTATAVFRNGGVSNLGPLDIEFRVLTPDESMYLKNSGEFRAFSGNEHTWKLNRLRLESNESHVEVFSVVGFSWPVGGSYILEASWLNECGQTVSSLRRQFVVAQDQDGDGIMDDQEAAYGLDWTDRDSDDDGLLDGQEGLIDSDNDTIPDALACDADADGIPDSVESGLTAVNLDPDTDLAAGCFVADADAGGTTTNRLTADTDGGGLEDGSEDVNRNGRVDAGEKDPAESWDDPCSTVTPPEATGLRLRKVAGDLVLSWDSLSGADVCVIYKIWSSSTLRPAQQELGILVDDLGSPFHGFAMPSGSRSYLIQAAGQFAGDGPLGYEAP